MISSRFARTVIIRRRGALPNQVAFSLRLEAGVAYDDEQIVEIARKHYGLEPGEYDVRVKRARDLETEPNPTRVSHPPATAADYDRIFGSNYDDL